MPEVGEEVTSDPDVHQLQRVRRYLRMGVVTRFIAVAGVLAAIRLPGMVPVDIEVIYLAAGIEIIANIAYLVVGLKRWPTAAFHFSGLVDVVAIGILISQSGGTSSYFVPLFALVIVFNGIFYGWPGALSGGVPSILGLWGAAALSPAGIQPPALAIEVGVWLALAYLAGTVGEHEKEARQELTNRARQISAIWETSSSIANHMEVEALLTMAAERTQELAASRWGDETVVAIALLDSQREGFRIVRVAGPQREASDQTVRYDSLTEEQRDLSERVEPYYLDEEDLRTIRENAHLPEPHGSGAFIAPLVVEDSSVGALSLRWGASVGRVDRSELEFVETIANHVGSALTRIQALDGERERRRQAVALFELARELSAITDLDRMLEVTAEAGVALARVDVCIFGLITDDEAFIEPRGWAVASDGAMPSRDEVSAVMGRIPIEEIADLMEERGPLTISEIDETVSESQRRFASLFAAKSVLVFPIFVRGRAAGALAFAYTDAGRKFSISQHHVGEAMAGLAAVAVENVRLLEDVSRRARENAALFEAARLVSSALEPADTLDRIVRAASEALGARRAAIFLCEDGGLRPAALKDPEPSHVPAFERLRAVSLSDELTSFLASANSIIVEEGKESPLPQIWAEKLGFEDFLITPLRLRERPLGMMLLEMPGNLTASGVELAEGFASLAAGAIENAGRYEQEKKTVAHLTELDRIKSEFVSTASHELRSPLTSITGYARTLLRPGADFSEEERREFLEVIDGQAKQLARLIDELLTVSRIEEGAITLAYGAVDVPAMVGDLFGSMSMRSAGHRFTAEFPDDFPRVVADEGKLLEILSNLVDNAVKYSPDGGEVKVGGKVADGEVQLWVSDEGIGIPPDALSAVFDRFYRTEDAPGISGTGLGLYIVKELAEAHGGRVWAESNPGKGTTFSLALPQRRAADPLVTPAEQARS